MQDTEKISIALTYFSLIQIIYLIKQVQYGIGRNDCPKRMIVKSKRCEAGEEMKNENPIQTNVNLYFLEIDIIQAHTIKLREWKEKNGIISDCTKNKFHSVLLLKIGTFNFLA